MNKNLNKIKTTSNKNNNFVDSEEFFKKSPYLFYNSNNNNNNSENDYDYDNNKNSNSNKKTNRLKGMKEFTFNNFKNSSMK
jgi:hypothetical protein